MTLLMEPRICEKKERCIKSITFHFNYYTVLLKKVLPIFCCYNLTRLLKMVPLIIKLRLFVENSFCLRACVRACVCACVCVCVCVYITMLLQVPFFTTKTLKCIIHKSNITNMHKSNHADISTCSLTTP